METIKRIVYEICDTILVAGGFIGVLYMLINYKPI